MFSHLFRLMWNKKKQNFLLITEIFVSFMVMFTIFALLVYYYQNYKLPRGFDEENVLAVNYKTPRGMDNKDSITSFNEAVRRKIKSMPEIKNVSFAGFNVPFAQGMHNGRISYEKTSVMSNFYLVADDYKDVLEMTTTEGKWFSKDDNALRENLVAINTSLKKAFFGNGTAIGKYINVDGRKSKISAVVNDVKDRSDFERPTNSIFIRADTANQEGLGAILVRVRATADAGFESRLFKALSNTVKDMSINIKHLDKMREGQNSIMLVPMVILLVVAGFLIINVALGLFGVLWYNINKRRGEIGLRRAVGATGKSVSAQLVVESLILATLALSVGTFFAIQFPLLNVFDLPASVYIIAIFLSIVFIYLLVFICSLYPGKQAAAVYPAVALHDE